MIPKNKVGDLISKHSLLEKELSSGEIDKKNFAEKSKDYSDLNEIIKEIKEYYSFEDDQKDLEKINQRASSRYKKAKESDKVSGQILKDMGLEELSDKTKKEKD